MRKVSKSSLKAKMFEYFRELEQSGGILVVTDFGRPVLQITPFQEKKTAAELFDNLRGKIRLNREAVLESTEREWDLKE